MSKNKKKTLWIILVLVLLLGGGGGAYAYYNHITQPCANSLPKRPRANQLWLARATCRFMPAVRER